MEVSIAKHNDVDIAAEMTNERERIAALLDELKAPILIKKSWPTIIGGNTNNLGAVWADKYGRLWSETSDELRLVYAPARAVKTTEMFSGRSDIRNEEVFSDRVNGRLRRTPEERAAFQETCPPQVRAAAQAMFDRFGELALRTPYSRDDNAWEDLADTALRAALKVNYGFDPHG